MSTIQFNNTHTYLHMYLRFCTQVRLKCCWLELRSFLQLHTHWPLERFQQSQTLVSLFGALLCTKYFKDKAEVCNLSIFKPKKPDLLFESRLYNPFLPLINTIPTSADTLKVLYDNYFLLTSMYLLRQYIY